MKTLKSFALLLSSNIAVCQTTLPVSTHNQKPVQSTDSILSASQTELLVNSSYARSLDSLALHVTGQKIMNTYSGNAGFILVLNNKSWAVAYRVDSMVVSSFGKGKIPDTIMNKINSKKLGNAAAPIGNYQISSGEKCDIKAELKKAYGNVITGLSIGKSTFNFNFENDMELEFLLVKDNNNQPAIRVFWEQW
ncbi:MAG: hypothetical protein JWR61_4999 [Ferruginibacter sp.]|uniref:hypothetical protein n=1 Tax=Ferruginibacter sp. TaxID=1940288 RepID=UPI00265B2547|nr:hypothetical protein [Ferruginibacter sp.]MDB5280044.1 hypothetical protein [Ferruginibacter sp.]